MVKIDKTQLQILKELNGLYVDDEPAIINFAKMGLKHCFKNFYTAMNGAEALENYESLIKNGAIQLVISDINMPKMNGIEFVKKVRELNKSVKILLVSGNADSKYLIEAINADIQSFILKPIQLEILINRTIELAQQYLNEQIIISQKQELENYIQTIDNVAIISHTDLQGHITYANSVFCEISGYSQEELLGKPHSIIRHPEMDTQVFKDLWKRIEKNEIWRGKIKNRAKDGSDYYTLVSIFPHYNHTNNEKIGYIGIRYLITKEELEKKEFRKQVIATVRQWKEKERELTEKIEHYKVKTSDTTKDSYNDVLQLKIEKEMQKNRDLLKKIDDLENDVEIAKNNRSKQFEILNKRFENLNKKFLEYRREQSGSDTMIRELKDKNNDQSNEIHRLSAMLKEQKNLIENLQDVIQHKEEEIVKMNEGKK